MSTSDPVYGSATVAGEEHQLVIGGRVPREESGKRSESETNVVVKTRQSNKAATGKCTILGEAAPGDELAISLAGNTVFTGTIKKPKASVGDRTRLIAYDALHRLKRTAISETFDTEAAATVLQSVADAAGVDIDVRTAAAEPITATFKDRDADSVIEKVTKLADAVWYVDAENTLVITEAGSVGEQRSLEQITDVSAGKRSPAYQSVRVVGNSPTSRKGRQSRQLVSSQPVVATAGSGEPQYEYEDDDIASQQQAQNVANAILKRLQKQQRGGFVEVVGRSDIRPFDTVEFPAAQGGSSYLAEGVKHTLSAKNGWSTRIQLGGVIDG